MHVGSVAKFEIRNTKSQGNPKFETRNSKGIATCGSAAFGFYASDLHGISGFVLRASAYAVCVMAIVFGGGNVYAQQKDFEIRAADVLNVKHVGTQQIQALIGRVQMVQPSPSGDIKIWCDSAFRNMQSNIVDLFGHVRIVRDSMTLTSTAGTYSGNDRRTVLPNDIRLDRGRMVLTSKYGEYWANDKHAYFRGDVHVVDSASSTWSDELTYFETEDKSIATGHVRVTSTENNLTVFGDSLVHFEKRKYTIVPKNPRLMQIDTAASGELDTLMIFGSQMEAYQDSLQRFVAVGKVEMARTDFAARCGEATYFYKRDRIVLRKQPVVWHADNQVSGDSIVIMTRDRKLQSVYVRGRAMAISRTDSLNKTRFNQLSAREVTLYFKDGKINQIDADRTATSLYFLFDGATPNGANRSSGDRIIMEFAAGKIDRIKIVGGVEGKYFPEKMIARHEKEYNLEGFRWITDRPRRKLLSIVHESYD
jgi:lipopolysaccharide export system protein LptA